MKKFDFLVTGGAGFIGSNFVRHILENTDKSVAVADSLTYSSNLGSLAGLDSSRFKLFEVDIRTSEKLLPLFDKVDTVVHFAAESHNDNSLHSSKVFLDTNVVGTYNVIEAIRITGKRLHHISTDEVFGDLAINDTKKFNENSRYQPSSPYSATKAASDLLVNAWIRSFGINATISNCSKNYGPRQHVEKFIPRQITNLAIGKPAVLYGSGKNVRDWIHVDDHSSAVLKIINSGKLGETYLIGAHGEKSNLEVLKSILNIMGRSSDEYIHIEDRPGHDLRYAIDYSKLSQTLGWKPKFTDFEQGLEKTIDWYLSNENWWRESKVKAENYYRDLGQA